VAKKVRSLAILRQAQALRLVAEIAKNLTCKAGDVRLNSPLVFAQIQSEWFGIAADKAAHNFYGS